jgi:hypothetical protein
LIPTNILNICCSLRGRYWHYLLPFLTYKVGALDIETIQLPMIKEFSIGNWELFG